jgi:rubrerythrin
MTKSIKGTNTEKCLLKSFIGESQANMRYTFFASKAKKDGFEQISATFTETAENEKEHAKRFFNFLEVGRIEIKEYFPIGINGTTVENLRFSVAGENEEHSKIYLEATKIADEEYFPEVAECFRRISVAEKYHESRFLVFLNNLENHTIFKKNTIIRWKCRNCGYTYESEEALCKCPACLHSKAYMEELTGNFYTL